MMRVVWNRIGLALCLLVLPVAALAQQTAPPAATPAPVVLSQQQMDTLVEAISRSVLDRLEKQKPSVPAASSNAAAVAASGMDNSGEARFFMRAGTLLSGLPALGRELATYRDKLEAPQNDGRPLRSFLALLALAVIVPLLAEWLTRRLLIPVQRRISATMTGMPGVRALFALALLEIPPILALWLASSITEATRLMTVTPQAMATVIVLKGIFLWRVLLAPLRFTLQPALPQARLPDLDDSDARAIFQVASINLLVIVMCRTLAHILTALGSPPDVISTAQIYAALAMGAVMIAASIRFRQPMARWFIGVTDLRHRSFVFVFLARYWVLGAVLMFTIVAGADVYAAIVNRHNVPDALGQTVCILVALLLIESLIHRIRVMLHASEPAEMHAASRGAIALARCLRFAILIGAVAAFARIWSVDGSGMMAGSDFNRLAGNMWAAGVTLFIGFCAWELVRYITDRMTGPRRVAGLPPGADSDNPGVEVASRLSTMMPLMRLAMAVVIGIMTVLTVLTQLGVNVTPLIAGASIFGLAISFGSQTLVKDVVSGVFYLIDDAFRIGEYIDCGKAKGTVEKFALRSLRLRHQNGPIHTIPYGQLGQITNYSRDWATIKFILKFAHGTDLEKLRKAVKKVGQDMLNDPEMQSEFLSPLKMQGLYDIAENALIVRFKFTVKPNNPSFIQREALRRLGLVLPPLGIEFASPAVAVRSLDGLSVSPAGAAATIAQAMAAAQASPS